MFSEFKPVSKQEWLTKVEKDLKGKKSINSFNWETDGMTFTPFYHQEDGHGTTPLINGKNNNNWEIGERIIVSDYKTANQQALSALTKGANALLFVLSESPNQSEMTNLLKDIQHEWISTHFNLKQPSWKRLIGSFIKVVEEKGQNLSEVNCSFQFESTPFDDIEQFKAYSDQLPKGSFFSISDFNTNLSTIIKEGNDVLVEIHKSGLDLSQYSSQIQFSIGVTDNYFVSIAKIRALKILWQQILNEWGIEKESCNINAYIIPNRDDENYNKIKTTTQAMSAVIGGADRLYIYPSDHQNTSKGTTFSRRIALNVQHLMQQESYLDRVADPAAGSYYIEELTNRIAEKAWNEFVKTL